MPVIAVSSQVVRTRCPTSWPGRADRDLLARSPTIAGGPHSMPDLLAWASRSRLAREIADHRRWSALIALVHVCPTTPGGAPTAAAGQVIREEYRARPRLPDHTRRRPDRCRRPGDPRRISRSSTFCAATGGREGHRAGARPLLVRAAARAGLCGHRRPGGSPSWCAATVSPRCGPSWVVRPPAAEANSQCRFCGRAADTTDGPARSAACHPG